MKKKLIILALLFATIYSGFSLDIGDPAEAIALPGLDGRFVMTGNIFKGNWVILDFFRTDCGPCIKELPEIEEFIQSLKGIEINGYILATDVEGSEIVKPYFDQNPTIMKVLIDRYQKTAERYGVTIIPCLYLIGPSGNVVFKQEEYSETLVEELREILTAEN